MTPAITFSRKDDAGSRACTTQYWENLLLVVVVLTVYWQIWRPFRRRFSEKHARENKKKKLRHHDVIPMNFTLIDHGSLPINARDMAQLFEKWP